MPNLSHGYYTSPSTAVKKQKNMHHTIMTGTAQQPGKQCNATSQPSCQPHHHTIMSPRFRSPPQFLFAIQTCAISDHGGTLGSQWKQKKTVSKPVSEVHATLPGNPETPLRKKHVPKTVFGHLGLIFWVRIPKAKL